MRKYIHYLIFLIFSSVTLSSCTPLLLGSAVTAGGLALTDRRTKGTIVDDRVAQLTIRAQIRRQYPRLIDLNDATKVSIPAFNVICYNHKVLLVGLVENDHQRKQLEQIAQSQKAVTKVYNYLKVYDQRSLADAANDVFLTSQIRLHLLAAPGFSPNDVKVMTYSGTTYVFGLLTPEEQRKASLAISKVPGVRKVVTLYETFDPQTGRASQ
ncbi:MAG: BON domain-containing protein [Neisseriaceae bacterium]